MGLYFLASSLDPVLNKGFNKAILNLSGNFNYFIERLNRSVIGLAKTCAQSCKNLPSIWSIPAGFAGFLSLINFKIDS